MAAVAAGATLRNVSIGLYTASGHEKNGMRPYGWWMKSRWGCLVLLLFIHPSWCARRLFPYCIQAWWGVEGEGPILTDRFIVTLWRRILCSERHLAWPHKTSLRTISIARWRTTTVFVVLVKKISAVVAEFKWSTIGRDGTAEHFIDY